MAFDAYKRVRDIAETALASLDLNAVMVEQGVTLPDIVEILRSRRESMQYPFIEITPPFIEVEALTGDSITTVSELWVNVFGNNADLDELDAQMQGYATALGRLFDFIQGDGYAVTLAGMTVSPPTDRTEGDWVQAVGARLTVNLMESI